MSGAGLLEAVPGPKGGYRLAKTPEKITLLDIVIAVEGPEPAFRCNEIRLRGPNPYACKPTAPCTINVAMLRAEQAYRTELRRVTIASILDDLNAKDDGSVWARTEAFLAINERKSSASA